MPYQWTSDQEYCGPVGKHQQLFSHHHCLISGVLYKNIYPEINIMVERDDVTYLVLNN